MGNSYKNCKIQDNTADLIYENGSLFVMVRTPPAPKVLQSRLAASRRLPHQA